MLAVSAAEWKRRLDALKPGDPKRGVAHDYWRRAVELEARENAEPTIDRLPET